MADFQIIDKDELTNVDRSADYILVYDFNAAKLVRSNVNSLLNLLSHPVGIDDVQTLTNKTITAPAISNPVLSGTITGTYTLGGTPTFPSAVVTLTGSQTLTNKVLTSPTINTANIVNPTLAVNTISEHTADNGVTIDGLNIKDGALTTANSVTNAALATESVSNSKLITTAGDIGGAWLAWTPTLSGILNNAKWTKDCKYTQIGKTIHFRVYLKANTTTPTDGAGSGAIFTLPVTTGSLAAQVPVIGQSGILDSGTARYTGFVEFNSTTTARVRYIDTAAAVGGDTETTSSAPFTWTTNDEIFCTGTYEAA
jgi:hypothetical protein